MRYSFAQELLSSKRVPDWLEVVPENWMKREGYFKDTLHRLRARFPFVCHGLSLSIGSTDELNYAFLKDIKSFLEEYGVSIYSEHLSFCSLGGSYVHDLLPLPFTENMVRFVSERVRVVQDFLERPLVLENISYYHQPLKELEEWEFINAVLEEGDAYLLLDVNNVYVNAKNHGYDPYEFLDRIAMDRVVYIHVAGHERFERLLIDTHGEETSREVYRLLKHVLSKKPDLPVLLERDNNIPSYPELMSELDKLRELRDGERA